MILSFHPASYGECLPMFEEKIDQDDVHQLNRHLLKQSSLHKQERLIQKPQIRLNFFNLKIFQYILTIPAHFETVPHKNSIYGYPSVTSWGICCLIFSHFLIKNTYMTWFQKRFPLIVLQMNKLFTFLLCVLSSNSSIRECSPNSTENDVVRWSACSD